MRGILAGLEAMMVGVKWRWVREVEVRRGDARRNLEIASLLQTLRSPPSKVRHRM